MSRIRLAVAYATLVLAALILVGCDEHPKSAGAVKVEYQTVDREVQRPCPVTVPTRPAPLARPLPADPGALASLLVAKLKAWAGPGGYGETADAALRTCTKP